MARQSGSVGNIQLEMGGCRVQGRKRKIKGNLTILYHTKGKRGKPKQHLLRCEMFRIDGERSELQTSSFSRFCSAYINLKFCNEHEYMYACKVKCISFTFLRSQKQISIHVFGWNAHPVLVPEPLTQSAGLTLALCLFIIATYSLPSSIFSFIAGEGSSWSPL